METKKLQKSCNQMFICEKCDYMTSRKSSYEKHLSTLNHQRVTMVTQRNHQCVCGKSFNCRQHLYRHKKTCDVEEIPRPENKKVANCFQMFPFRRQTIISTQFQIKHNSYDDYICDCGKKYKSRSGLWKHKKTCNFDNNQANLSEKQEVFTTENDEVLELLCNIKEDNEKLNIKLSNTEKQLEELKNTASTAPTQTKVVNNYNINIFLNDKCSDAIAIHDFARTLMISLEDVEYTLENGKVKGIQLLIGKKLEELGVYQRPWHCTDPKRQTLYVKNENGWGRETGEVVKMIKDVEHRQTEGIKVWEEAHPGERDGNDKQVLRWLKVVQCLTGKLNEVGINKIVKHCSENTYLERLFLTR